MHRVFISALNFKSTNSPICRSMFGEGATDSSVSSLMAGCCWPQSAGLVLRMLPGAVGVDCPVTIALEVSKISNTYLPQLFTASLSLLHVQYTVFYL